LVVAVGVVMAAMLALSAGPAMADDFDLDVDDVLGNNGVLLEGDDDEEFFVVDEDEGLFDALCSPGIDIDLTGCIFSDGEDDDFLDDDNEIDFVSLDDDDLFDDDDEVDFRFIDDDDRHDNNNDNERSFTRIIDRH